MTGTSAEDAAGPAERRRRGATTLDCAHASRPRPAHSRLITCTGAGEGNSPFSFLFFFHLSFAFTSFHLLHPATAIS